MQSLTVEFSCPLKTRCRGCITVLHEGYSVQNQTTPVLIVDILITLITAWPCVLLQVNCSEFKSVVAERWSSVLSLGTHLFKVLDSEGAQLGGRVVCSAMCRSARLRCFLVVSETDCLAYRELTHFYSGKAQYPI